MEKMWTPTERLALTKAEDEVVPYNSSKAASLFCIPGRPIPWALAEKYGLVEEKPEVKESKPEETKDRKPTRKRKT